DYMKVYEDVFNHTSTAWAPWYIIPADRKWFTRLAVAYIIDKKLEELDLKYPTVSEDHKQHLLQAKELLENE
ncbi:MAG: polyphosphate kinase 2 family protein, partial [Microcystaceae cyanobacterium]